MPEQLQRAMAAEAEAAREARAKVEMMMIVTSDGGDVAGDIDERQGQGEHENSKNHSCFALCRHICL